MLGATMPSTIRIIRAHDFIRVTPNGQLDLEQCRKLLLEIASTSVALGGYEILLDTRGTRTQISKGDLFFLAAELRKRPDAFSRRTAVLCPLERFDRLGSLHFVSKTEDSQSRHSLLSKTQSNG